MFKGAHRERVQLAVKAPVGSSRKRIKGYLKATFPNGSEEIALCIIDTGAECTAIPQWIWSQHITRDAVLQIRQKKRIGGVGGGVVDVVETEMPLELTGLDFLSDTAFDLGKCRVWLAFDDESAKPMKQVLLGVGGGVLDKGGLCINWKEEQVYFVEVDDVHES